jgi:hypothetical protein
LGRLATNRWVRAEKAPGTDQRATWYRIREPLLRHHLHYRSAVDQPLPLIVELLRAWFDPSERRSHLLRMRPGSSSEAVLAHSLTLEPHRFDSAYNDRDIDQLLVDARRWIGGGDPGNRTPEAGALIEYVILAVRQGMSEAGQVLQMRAGHGVDVAPVAYLDDIARKRSECDTEVDVVAKGLRLAAEHTEGDTHKVLELISACWDGQQAPTKARERLQRLLLESDGNLIQLDLNIAQEVAFWTGEAGEPAKARDQLATLIDRYVHLLGPDHLDTLGSRSNLAGSTGEAGEPAKARDQYTSLVADLTRVLGPDHLHTLTARHSLAYNTGEAGDRATARDQYTSLIADLTRVLGPDHPHAFAARHSLAYITGEAGDPAAARDQYTALVADLTRVLGPDDLDTFNARRGLAYNTGLAGDYAAARDQFSTLAADYFRTRGADSSDGTWSLALSYEWAAAAGTPMWAIQRLSALSYSETASADVTLIDSINAVVSGILPTAIRIPEQDDPIDPELPLADLLSTLRAAAAGDPEALARVPLELRPLVTDDPAKEGETGTKES